MNLLPAIVQDVATRQVLMLGYMNDEALQQTIQTKKVTFFSRSKNRIWVKGETSGNFLDFVEVKFDCDKDALLILAKPNGPTCHEGTQSCFANDAQLGIGFLQKLWQTIDERYQKRPEGSYTTKLFEKGTDRIAQKVGEEAVETVIAAKNEAVQPLLEEASDLLYHLLVLLRAKSVGLDQVLSVLASRHK